MPEEKERMRNAGRGPTLAITISLMLIFIWTLPGVSFELSADSITAGKNLIISGTSEPNSEQEFLTSFTMNLPVASGRYSYETEVKVPNKPNRFAVTARNVQNLDAGVKMGLWITKSFEAQDGTVYLSGDDIPPGRYGLKVSGSAIPGKSEVPITIEAKTSVVADSKGRYKLIIDTTGIPESEYLIEGDGDAKTVQILGKDKKHVSAAEGSKGENTAGSGVDKNGINPDAGAGSASESITEKSVQKESGAIDNASPPAQSGQSKGVIASLAEWLGL